jgi:hypothetical protein
MNATTRRPSDLPKAYKAKLLLARRMRGDSQASLFDRATLLMEVFDDQEFRADYGNLDAFKAAELLDAECSDTCFEFLQLRELLAAYPARSQWENGNLAKMYRDAKKAAADPAPAATPPRKHVLITETQHAQAVERAKRLEVQVKELLSYKSEAEALRERLEQARLRIDELERENDCLRRQLSGSETVCA